MLETITLTVAGRVLPHTSARLSASAEQAVRNASFDVAWTGSGLPCGDDEECTVHLSGELWLTGYVRDINWSHDASNRTYSVAVVSRTVDATESSIDHPTGSLEQCDLRQIAADFDTARIGVECDIATEPKAVHQIIPGETLYETIRSETRANGALVYDTANGKRGCSEAAVRKAIADGRLKKAVLADGSIDAHRADELLAQSTIASREPPSELSEARVRKLRAQCALLQDEIEDLEKGLATPEEVAFARRLAFDHVIGVLHSMLDELVPRLMGVEAVEASAIIQETVYKTLDELAKMNPFGDCESAAKQKHLKVEKLNGVQLEALKTSLQARRLEVQSSQRSGALVFLPDVKTEVIACFINVRAKMLALHNRSAPQLVHVDAARAREVLTPMVAEMVEALRGR